MNEGEDKPTNSQPEVWGRKQRIVIGVVASSLVVLFFVLWCMSSDITYWALTLRGISGQDAKNLEHQALFGDSYGAMNALFSAIALVAAVTAVAFQVVELGGQRQEISMQLDEMKQSNITNNARLAFDREIHLYDKVKDNEHRRLRLISQLGELQTTQLLEAQEGLGLLKIMNSVEGIARWALDADLFGSPVSTDFPQNLNITQKHYDAAKKAVVVLEYLHRVSMSEWSDREFMYFMPFIERHSKLLEEFAKSVREQDKLPCPAWACSFPVLSARSHQIYKTNVWKQWFESEAASQL